MGSLVPQDSPIAWRGLMIQKAMNQLLFEVSWPKLDLLILDLPPGTGDVQLTITQSIELNGTYYSFYVLFVDCVLTTYRCRHSLNAARSRSPRCRARR